MSNSDKSIFVILTAAISYAGSLHKASTKPFPMPEKDARGFMGRGKCRLPTIAELERAGLPVPAAGEDEGGQIEHDDGPEFLLGSDKQPATIQMGSKNVPLGEIVDACQRASQMTRQAWNDQPEADREAALALFIELEQSRAVKAEKKAADAAAKAAAKAAK